ncbi:ComF family protein [Desulfosporosinus sp. PR]|uniref:ComF family protein n=1 Tax=Candidatus Desulfosporosinus nitrosoreducens TaxID=3401928 RepID=UPI0027F8CAFB|nr:ComF family protein [Desulfosporosinus sp. PR]MDQ7093048.1 ComF family protein [Desulfosporosinus sp. PR]
MITLARESAKIIRSLWYTAESACVLCSGKHGPICPDCTREYLHPELGRCLRCGKLIVPEKVLCLDCEIGKGPKQLERVAVWGHYSGGLKRFIRELKFASTPLHFQRIARPLTDWAIKALPAVDGVVAVPMHPARLAERGFNQAEVIASLLHWELGLPIFQGLERVKLTPPQVALSRRERLSNLKGAFALRKPDSFQGREVWIVDDVTTTGSTLEAVAEVLRGNGAKAVYGFCLAAGLEKVLVPLSD